MVALATSRLLILFLLALGSDGFVMVSDFGDTSADAGSATTVDDDDRVVSSVINRVVFGRDGVSIAWMAAWMKEPGDLIAPCAWFWS
ncbi:hypothetical protein RchiOBHm_Chr4g0442601 [Rosa chinensis]|uniref:Secreted protein n=1 Tax=Rosa chinensis TaxID=74649 RepID=A0A2P6R3P4_ROSCH|nr:hypothetical protein RchiOBHm_Chr4g0442601 [Rosa chinensis]